jgi:thiol-disulfide isomerase/thioredoxin
MITRSLLFTGAIFIAMGADLGIGFSQDQSAEPSIPLTNEEFQRRAKSKQLAPFIIELDRALEKSPTDLRLLGLELQVAQNQLINDRKTGLGRFREWVAKLEKLPRTPEIDKFLVAGVYNATVVLDPAIAEELISWIDLVFGRIPTEEYITQANLKGNRLSLQGQIQNREQLEAEFTVFFNGLVAQTAEKKIPVSVLASQAMRYKSLFWITHRDQALKNLSVARQAYIEYLQQGTVSASDVFVYIQFMTTFANEIAREIPRESFAVLNELKDQLQLIQPKLPAEQKSGLQATIKSIEQGLTQMAVAIRKMDLIGTEAPAILEAQFSDVPESLQKELKGKTVLLTFWAAWSEPCLKSLARIDQIGKEFQDQGVVVIGVTKWYGMVWDDSTKTPDRQADVSPEAELKALRSIAQHYGTEFGIAVVPETSNLYEQYQVSGIPQLVLVGPDGLIKLFRPGLTEEHFKSIEEEIRKLIKPTN